YFQDVESYFLCEEFIEGQDLKQWFSQNFPFIKNSYSISNYAISIKKILLQLFPLIDNMHKNGVAMCDLQPANVIVTNDLTVKLIDFDTAMHVNSDDKRSMATIGFVSQEMKVSAARDWFGVKRLVRY